CLTQSDPKFLPAVEPIFEIHIPQGNWFAPLDQTADIGLYGEGKFRCDIDIEGKPQSSEIKTDARPPGFVALFTLEQRVGFEQFVVTELCISFNGQPVPLLIGAGGISSQPSGVGLRVNSNRQEKT